MLTIYVIVEEGWDYNDEYFYRSENGGGHPRTAFDDKSCALAKLRLLNIAEVKNILSSSPEDIYCHLGEGETITSKLTPGSWGRHALGKEDFERLTSYFDVEDSEFGTPEKVGISISGQNKVPDDDWILLGKCLGLTSYELYEIPLNQKEEDE